MMRIGHGYDVHRFGEGSYITLGGVQIEYTQGFIAHSDGDVLLHAICDALLGAVALGDIGHHFPDTGPAFKGVDSRSLLREVMRKVAIKGYCVANIDCTIQAQAPKLAPYIAQMCKVLAQDLNVQLDQVNVKATTTEKLGFVGEKLGIAAHAVVLLSKIHD